MGAFFATVGILVTTVFALTLSPAEATLRVEWRDGRLSVEAERTPLSRILREISRQTGLEFSGVDVGALHEEVSVRFTELPLREGVRRLLPQLNYTIVEGTSATQVLIFGRRSGGSLEAVQGKDTGELAGQHSATTGIENTPGTALEDEGVRERDHGNSGTPLADEENVKVAMPHEGGTPLQDELAVAQVAAHPGGTELPDERDARTSVRLTGTPLDDEPDAR